MACPDFAVWLFSPWGHVSRMGRDHLDTVPVFFLLPGFLFSFFFFSSSFPFLLLELSVVRSTVTPYCVGLASGGDLVHRTLL